MSDTFRLRVRLTPRGGRDRIEGWIEDSDGARLLKARVAAPPADGAANEALVRLLARALDVPKSAVRIGAGATSRLKTIEIDGNPVLLTTRLEQLTGR